MEFVPLREILPDIAKLERMQVQSDYAPYTLHAFRHLVCDERYEERIRCHYAAFKEEIRRLNDKGKW